MSRFPRQNSDTIDPAIVEAIVQEVVVRLSEKTVEHSGSMISAGQKAPSDSESALSEFELGDRVVTLERLRGQLNGRNKLIVRPGAVVTPAVRDELKSRNITLETRPAREGTQKSPLSNICLARLSDHFVPLEWLKKVGVNQVCCGEDYSQIAEQLAREHAGGKTICLAAQPFVAVALLNRNETLRAAFGRTPQDVREIRATLNANVLVLDRIQNRQELLQLIQDFTTDSGRSTS